MTPEEAFRLINSLDYEEKKRRFAPKWSIVSFDESGRILNVARFKECPHLPEEKAEFKKYPKSMQFRAIPGQIQTVDALINRINDSIRVVRLVELPENRGKRWVRG